MKRSRNVSMSVGSPFCFQSGKEKASLHRSGLDAQRAGPASLRLAQARRFQPAASVVKAALGRRSGGTDNEGFQSQSVPWTSSWEMSMCIITSICVLQSQVAIRQYKISQRPSRWLNCTKRVIPSLDARPFFGKTRQGAPFRGRTSPARSGRSTSFHNTDCCRILPHDMTTSCGC